MGVTSAAYRRMIIMTLTKVLMYLTDELSSHDTVVLKIAWRATEVLSLVFDWRATKPLG